MQQKASNVLILAVLFLIFGAHTMKLSYINCSILGYFSRSLQRREREKKKAYKSVDTDHSFIVKGTGAHYLFRKTWQVLIFLYGDYTHSVTAQKRVSTFLPVKSCNNCSCSENGAIS